MEQSLRNLSVGADIGIGPNLGQIRVTAECGVDRTIVSFLAADLPAFDPYGEVALVKYPLAQLAVDEHLRRCSSCGTGES